MTHHSPATVPLTLEFEGWFQCRLATDPDPTREPRGVSGYVFAVGRETDFDRVIYLQKEDIPHGDRDYREAEVDAQPREVGVEVKGVILGGTRRCDSPLLCAKVRLLRRPEYVLWNQIVADGVERLVPPIIPFEIEVRRRLECGREIVLRRYDPLVLAREGDRVWEIADPAEYLQRLPVNYVHRSSEVVEATGIKDFNAYFQRRKEWLEIQRATATDAVDRSAFGTRIEAIERFSETSSTGEPGLIANRLGLQCTWEHPIRGEATIEGAELLGGSVLHGSVDDQRLYWHTRFWHGAWDGDLMRGYMKGKLEIPFQPASRLQW